jgi:hypothetical protein
MSTSVQKRKRHTEEVLDGVIVAAKITKDVGETVPILAPLKGAIGMLITALEHAKVSHCGNDSFSRLRRHYRKLKRTWTNGKP